MGMNNFSNFILFLILCNSMALVLIPLSYKRACLLQYGIAMMVVYLIAFSIFLSVQWLSLERPPMRSLGETRLWYSYFLPFIGLMAYLRWKFSWFLWYTSLTGTIFLAINYFHPENFSKSLMPALQSPWFIPHVILFIFSYAILASTAILACAGLVQKKKTGSVPENYLSQSDTLVRIGLGFFTIAMLLGALWAKEAWGHYWSWDPKETWSFITWMTYKGYIHLRIYGKISTENLMITLMLALLFMMICWFGVNYLPSAQSSVHVYSNG